MRTQLGFLRHRNAVFALIAAVATLGFTPAAARADRVGYFVDPRFGLGRWFNFGGTGPATTNFETLEGFLRGDGHTLVEVNEITPASLAGLDQFYMPISNDNVSGRYPLSDAELAVLMAFNAAGHNIIWQGENLIWAQEQNNLFARLGFATRQSTVWPAFGNTSFSDANLPVLNGPHGTVGSWDLFYACGAFDVIDPRMIDVMQFTQYDPYSPYQGTRSNTVMLDRGWDGGPAGAMFFLTDVNGICDTFGEPDYFVLVRNMFDYGKVSVHVEIDIKPGCSPNTVNLGSNGNIPVAIFSTAEFDATAVDPLTVKLAGATVELRGNGGAVTEVRDVNRDGLPDLVIHIDTSRMDLPLGDTLAVLTGKTLDGSSIEGSDTVRIVP